MEIVFDSENHSYINSVTKEPYISVTTLISKYKTPFDADAMSKKVAAKQGTTQDKILGLWANITKTAQDRGTNYHKIMENYIKSGVIESGYEVLVESFAKKTKDIIKSDPLVESEKLLYNHDYKIAGTADLIITTKNGFHILDFKTNKRFGFYNNYNTFFIEPLEYLTQCEFTTYSLQLSIYAYLMEQLIGKPCLSLKVFYLREFDSVFWQEIHTPYMKDTVKKLLDYHKNNNKIEVCLK